MKFSISNIAWSAEQDKEVLEFLAEKHFDGIEVAPTRIFAEKPYSKIRQAKKYRSFLWDNYRLEVASIQSIWYGRNENIFGSTSERTALLEYSKCAFEFANALNCKNLVFGCPKNRNMREPHKDLDIAYAFFKELGEEAEKAGVVIALEANPKIYHTNFINFTEAAYEFSKKINSPGIGVNYDMGTVVANGEKIEDVRKYIKQINHVHISEPFLEQIKFGKQHIMLLKLLYELNYKNYISVEMKASNSIEGIKDVLNILFNQRSTYEMG